MKEGFRQSMAWLHTWTGLIVGWVLFFVFLTGTVGYFTPEITRWMKPELPLQQKTSYDHLVSINKVEQQLQQIAPKAENWRIYLPNERNNTLTVRWSEKIDDKIVYERKQFDPNTGMELISPETRQTGGGNMLYWMHYTLKYIPYEVALKIVGICTILMLLAIITGVITHKKIFKDFFTFRPNKGQRSWLDAHNVISVIALPFFLMITYSGLVFFMDRYMPAASIVYINHLKQNHLPVQKADDHINEGLRLLSRSGNQRFDSKNIETTEIIRSGLPLQSNVTLANLVRNTEQQWQYPVAEIFVDAPNDQNTMVTLTESRQRYLVVARQQKYLLATGQLLENTGGKSVSWWTRDGLYALHIGDFAGWGLRWLYFISGLLGCAMIATGLILWVIKRRREQDKRLKQGKSVAFGFRLVESLNISTIIGLPTAIAAYFWANRLLSVHFDKRAEWEFHCMFIVWGVLLIYTAVRLSFTNSLHVWKEQCYIAIFAFSSIPIINFITTDKHLFNTITYGDWVLAIFDFMMLVLAFSFAYIAYRLHLKINQPVAVKKSMSKNKKN